MSNRRRPFAGWDIPEPPEETPKRPAKVPEPRVSAPRAKRVSRMPPKAKTCPRCKVEKDIEEFAINRATPTGRDYICKQCAIDAAAERLRRKRAAEGREVGIYQKAVR